MAVFFNGTYSPYGNVVRCKAGAHGAVAGEGGEMARYNCMVSWL